MVQKGTFSVTFLAQRTRGREHEVEQGNPPTGFSEFGTRKLAASSRKRIFLTVSNFSDGLGHIKV